MTRGALGLQHGCDSPRQPKLIDARWRFFRDVMVFELKMLIGNLRDFGLMPVSVGAAIIDLISRGDREGSLFCRVCVGALVATRCSMPIVPSGTSCTI